MSAGGRNELTSRPTVGRSQTRETTMRERCTGQRFNPRTIRAAGVSALARGTATEVI
jgi:hypothetical protein